jgi:hypothetical protein
LWDDLHGVNFKNVIPDVKHRTQLLHDMAIGDLKQAYYVVASATKIIRVVNINASPRYLHLYRLALKKQMEAANLDWILQGEVPEFPANEYVTGQLKYASSKYTIKKTLELWRHIHQKIIDRGRPLPKGRLILPYIVALWNRCKGPIDMYSRFLRNVTSKHVKLPARGAVWLRLIMTCVYNGFQSYALYKSSAFLLSQECRSFRDYQHNRTLVAGSYASYCAALVRTLHLYNMNQPGVELIAQMPPPPVLPPPIQIKVTYNLRKLFFVGQPMEHLHTDQALRHAEALLPFTKNNPNRRQARCCALCCSNNHPVEGMCNARNANRTCYFCPDCRIALCTQLHFNGTSCHELWHAINEVPKTCVMSRFSYVYNRIRQNESIETLNERELKALNLRIMNEAVHQGNRTTAANLVTELIPDNADDIVDQQGRGLLHHVITINDEDDESESDIDGIVTRSEARRREIEAASHENTKARPSQKRKSRENDNGGSRRHTL